jgi:aminoglycoside phosphotransferase (APT) family kinase protein
LTPGLRGAKFSAAVLDLADIEPYLIERGLLSARAVVDGGLRVADVSRLNRVFLVTAEGERCLVLKLADEPGSDSVAREAAVLEWLWSSGTGDGLARFLPPVVAYDRAEGVLILEAASGTRDLTHHHARGRFSRALAGQVGRALACLHELSPSALGGLPGGVDPTTSLRVHQPDLDSLHEMSSAAVNFTEVLQSSDEICASLDALLASWSPGSAIHEDVRWDNCLALRETDSNRGTGLQLIDWELAAAGDPALDIGAFFGEYLRAWLRSIPIVDAREPGRLLAHAGMPLGRMRPALKVFWDTYARQRCCSAAELSYTLRRATRFAGARLLNAALEEAQTLVELRPSVLYLVPLGRNVLVRPDEASAQLLGLGVSREAA